MCPHGRIFFIRSLWFSPCWRRRRLQLGEEPCGIEAIVAACNEAFGVETCECIQHSDGGCPVPDIVETAGNGTETAVDTTAADFSTDGESGTDVEAGAIGDGDGIEKLSQTASPSTSPDATQLEEGVVVAEVGAGGRLLQENGQTITTDLEITFVTDVEVRTERRPEA